MVRPFPGRHTKLPELVNFRVTSPFGLWNEEIHVYQTEKQESRVDEPNFSLQVALVRIDSIWQRQAPDGCCECVRDGAERLGWRAER